MEHQITAPQGGIVRLIAAKMGDTLFKDDPIIFIEPAEIAAGLEVADEDVDLDAIRPDLAEMIGRQAFTLDENRPDAIARRRKTNQRTTRENIAALVDEGSFIEYGSLALAAQRARRTHDDLIRNTPADGFVAGLGTVNGNDFEAGRARYRAAGVTGLDVPTFGQFASARVLSRRHAVAIAHSIPAGL